MSNIWYKRSNAFFISMGFTVVADCGIVSIIIIIIISDFILHTNCIVIESRVSGIFSFNHYPSCACTVSVKTEL
jgi:hypothetical protein